MKKNNRFFGSLIFVCYLTGPFEWFFLSEHFSWNVLRIFIVESTGDDDLYLTYYLFILSLGTFLLTGTQ